MAHCTASRSVCVCNYVCFCGRVCENFDTVRKRMSSGLITTCSHTFLYAHFCKGTILLELSRVKWTFFSLFSIASCSRSTILLWAIVSLPWDLHIKKLNNELKYPNDGLKQAKCWIKCGKSPVETFKKIPQKSIHEKTFVRNNQEGHLNYIKDRNVQNALKDFVYFWNMMWKRLKLWFYKPTQSRQIHFHMWVTSFLISDTFASRLLIFQRWYKRCQRRAASERE